MKALEKTPVPVPRMYALCTDESVIGQTFFVSEFLEGRVLKDLASVPDHAERAIMMDEMARVLAQLHSVDPERVGLLGFSREGNYYVRQCSVWARQWQNSKVEAVPEMEELIDIIRSPEPQLNSRIVHGDYRLENVMWHPTQPLIIGVLDWEICTLGDARADVAYSQMYSQFSGAMGLDFAGIPPQEHFVRQYCLYARLPQGIDGLVGL